MFTKHVNQILISVATCRVRVKLYIKTMTYLSFQTKRTDINTQKPRINTECYFPNQPISSAVSSQWYTNKPTYIKLIYTRNTSPSMSRHITI